MSLTPTDIRNVTFNKPPIGKRGYHEEEVDAFLEHVRVELSRLIDQNNDLRHQLEQRDRQLRAAQAEPPRVVSAAPPPRAPSMRGHDTQAAKVLGMAQQIADRLTTDAKVEANGVLGDARAKAEQLLSDARVKADGMVSEARSRAQNMIDSAHGRAADLERQSHEKAETLERDATRKHAEIIGSISREKAVLEKKVEELSTFEKEYRTRVKIYLEAQLRELDLRAFVVPAETVRDKQDFTSTAFSPPAASGEHRADPVIGCGAADVATLPAQRNGSLDSEILHNADVTDMRWQPAV